jgi:hypothetical protein
MMMMRFITMANTGRRKLSSDIFIDLALLLHEEKNYLI